MYRALALFLASSAVFAQVPFTQFVVFGDSLSDNGNLYYGTSLLGLPTPGPPLYATGQYTDGANSVPSTTGPLGLWIEQLASKMNLPVLQPYTKGGLNYAVAGALTGTNPQFAPGIIAIPYCTDQLNLFLASNPKPSANYLYTFWCGGNDLLAGLDPVATVANVQANIDTLAKAGAKYFFWANQPPVGEIPENINTSQRAAFDVASVAYNNAWSSAIAQLKAAHPGIVIVGYDAYSGFFTLTQNASIYGFVNLTSPAQGLTGVNPNTYLFWDTIHPTTEADADVAIGAYNAIESAFNALPLITAVENAFGGSWTIAANTWLAVKGSLLSAAGDSRIWLGSDFVNNQMPTELDGVSVTMNSEKAFVYFISPGQLNILTPPDLMPGTVEVQVTANGQKSAVFPVEVQALSPTFFLFDSTHVVAVHLNGSDIGPTTLYPGLTTPARPSEVVVLFANGFGPTSTPVVSGSSVQSGSLSPLPAVTIGGATAVVQFAGLVAPGEFQFNVTVPTTAQNGDNPIVATYNGVSTPSGAVITVQQ